MPHFHSSKVLSHCCIFVLPHVSVEICGSADSVISVISIATSRAFSYSCIFLFPIQHGLLTVGRSILKSFKSTSQARRDIEIVFRVFSTERKESVRVSVFPEFVTVGFGPVFPTAPFSTEVFQCGLFFSAQENPMGNKVFSFPRVVLAEDLCLHYKAADLKTDVGQIVSKWYACGAPLGLGLEVYIWSERCHSIFSSPLNLPWGIRAIKRFFTTPKPFSRCSAPHSNGSAFDSTSGKGRESTKGQESEF